MNMKKITTLLAVSFFAGIIAFANPIKPPRLVGLYRGENYDESKTNMFEIPNILAKRDGKGEIKTALEWEQINRKWVISVMESEMYGKMPPRPAEMKVELRESSDNALGGVAKRRQYIIHLKDKGGEISFNLLLYLPKTDKPVPAIILPNFYGNHTITTEPEIFMPTCWMRNQTGKNPIVSDNKPHESQRGKMAKTCPVEDVVKRGYALATYFYCEIYPDKEKDDGASESIYKIFPKDMDFDKRPATVAWAWGNSRVVDCLETLPEIDSTRIGVTGHSRLGRTSILTGAYDKRIALVLANNPGHMGSAISRRRFGESIRLITTAFPYWFVKNLDKYQDNEGELPIDQHHVVACIAPRAVYIASASKDFWADPKGELMGLVEASKIYKLYGAKNTPSMDNLELEKQFIGDNIGYHLSNDIHAMTHYNWYRYLDFADKVFGKK